MLNKNKNKRKSVLMKVNIMLAVLVVFSYLGSLLLSNHGANQSYTFAKSLTEYQALQSEQQKLLNRVAELQSPNRLLAETGRMSLVKATNVAYVSAGGAVALNR